MTLSDDLRSTADAPIGRDFPNVARELRAAADRIDDTEAENERLRCSGLVLRAQVAAQVAELERTRQAWVDGDEPDCEDVCMVACKGPCGGAS